MDPSQQAEEELTEVVCRESDLKDGQWVCVCWYNVYLHNNTIDIQTKLKTNKPLVGYNAEFYWKAWALIPVYVCYSWAKQDNGQFYWIN